MFKNYGLREAHHGPERAEATDVDLVLKRRRRAAPDEDRSYSGGTVRATGFKSSNCGPNSACIN